MIEKQITLTLCGPLTLLLLNKISTIYQIRSHMCLARASVHLNYFAITRINEINVYVCFKHFVS